MIGIFLKELIFLNMNKESLLTSKMCVLPWTHLATYPNGQVVLCCMSNSTSNTNKASTDRLLNLNVDSPNIMLKSDSFTKTRAEMVNNIEPRACSICYDMERRGVKSKRIYEIENYFTVNEDFDSSVLDMQFIELRLGNLCNLQCVSCNPYSSKIMEKTFNQLSDLKFVIQGGGGINTSWAESEYFWDELLKNVDSIKRIYINGGEPTLIQQHWKFLDKLINLQVAHRIKLIYNTNTTLIKQEYIDRWNKFKSIEIGCSIDDIGDRNYFIRYPANWETLVKNIRTLKQNEKFIVYVSATISFLNCFYIDEIISFWKNENIDVALNFINNPVYLRAGNMPTLIKQNIIDRASLVANSDQLKLIKDVLGFPENPEEFRNGLIFLERIAKIRDIDIKDIFKEFYKNSVHFTDYNV